MRDGELDVNATPLGLLGLPWSDLTEKAWNQTLTHLGSPGLQLGDNSRNTRLLPQIGEVTRLGGVARLSILSLILM